VQTAYAVARTFPCSGAQPQTFLNPERAQNASPAAEAIADTGAAMASERALWWATTTSDVPSALAAEASSPSLVP